MNSTAIYKIVFSSHRAWWVSGALLSCLTGVTALLLLTLSGWFISASAIAGFGDALAFNFMLPAAQIRALAMSRTLSRYAERVITHEATFRVLADLRSWLFQQLIPLVPGRLGLFRSGDVLSRLTADIDALDAVYLRGLAPSLVATLGTFCVVLYLAHYSLLLSLLTGFMLCIAAIAIPWWFAWLGRDGAEKLVTLATNFRIRQLDLLQGWADLVANRAQTRFMQTLLDCSAYLINSQRQNNRLTALSSALTLVLSQLTLLLALCVATLLFRDGSLTGPELAIIFFCVLAVFELIMPLPMALQLFPKTQKAAQRISEIASLQASICEPENPMPIPQSFDILFEQVGFHYAERDSALRKINLTIPYGSKIAITGASGAGKSTLLHLLMHFYDPQYGTIRLGGLDLKAYQSDDLLSCFGMLSQHSQLFATTIRENVLIAKPSATPIELSAAITMAGLESFINSLPEGLDTWVGESGVKVSGGEARRIALARLYLKDAPIIVLDEPTEGLDTDTEVAVLQALSDFAKNKTMLMVTHREAGLKWVDRVYRLEDGVLECCLS